MAYLDVKNITKSFGKERILNDVSFSLEEGETLCIIGRSGCGKTTLLRCLNSLESIDGGKVELKGECILEASSNKKLKKRLNYNN